MRIAGRLVLVALALLTAAPAWSAPPTKQAQQAEEAFQRARRLMAQGKVAEACPLFEESQRLAPGLGTHLNLGGCYETDGRQLLAYRTYRDVERQARASGRTERETEARDRAAALAGKVALLVVQLAPGEGAFTFTADAETIEVPPPPEPVALAPGAHTVVVKSGASTYERKVDLAAGSTTTLDLATAAPAPVVTVLKPDSPALGARAGSSSSSSSTYRIAGFAALGLGVVAIGVGSVFALRATSTYGDSDAHCPARGCDAEGLSLVSSARASGDVATVSFVVAAVGLAAGAVLLFLAPSPKPATAWVTGVHTF